MIEINLISKKMPMGKIKRNEVEVLKINSLMKAELINLFKEIIGENNIIELNVNINLIGMYQKQKDIIK